MGGSHADVSKHVRAYVGVFIALAAGTIVTVLASKLDTSGAWHVAIALLIAAVKASLVAAIFMHLKWERGISIWWTLVFCAIFFLVLIFLPVLTSHDLPAQAQFGMWDQIGHSK